MTAWFVDSGEGGTPVRTALETTIWSDRLNEQPIGNAAHGMLSATTGLVIIATLLIAMVAGLHWLINR